MSSASRLKFEIDASELQRRWQATRQAMERAGVDVLVVQGHNNLAGHGGTFYWLTGTPPASSYPQTVIFPLIGDMTVVRHGAFGEVRSLDPADIHSLGMDTHIGTPTFPMVHYTLGYDADLVAGVLKKKGYRKIGTAAMASAYAGFVTRLLTSLSEAPVDMSDAIDRLKARKSSYEIGLLQQAAGLQDKMLDAVKSFILPGMRDQDVMAEVRRIGEVHGAEGGVYLGSSFSFDEGGVPVRHPFHQSRRICEGDLFYFLAENSGPGGMYVHASRFYSLGRPPQELIDGLGMVVEAQHHAVSLLEDGRRADDIHQAFNNYLAARGMPEDRRLFAHGQGYDLVERPLIRNDEPMEIAHGLNIGVHPAVFVNDNFVSMTDNFLFNANGIERLHKTPQVAFEL